MKMQINTLWCLSSKKMIKFEEIKPLFNTSVCRKWPADRATAGRLDDVSSFCPADIYLYSASAHVTCINFCVWVRSVFISASELLSARLCWSQRRRPAAVCLSVCVQSRSCCKTRFRAAVVREAARPAELCEDCKHSVHLVYELCSAAAVWWICPD